MAFVGQVFQHWHPLDKCMNILWGLRAITVIIPLYHKKCSSSLMYHNCTVDYYIVWPTFADFYNKQQASPGPQSISKVKLFSISLECGAVRWAESTVGTFLACSIPRKPIASTDCHRTVPPSTCGGQPLSFNGSSDSSFGWNPVYASVIQDYGP